MNILFKYTSKSRPSRFINGLDSIVSNLTDLENYKILCSFDANDAAYMNTEFLEKVSSYKKVIIVVGNSTSKIDAINRDVNDINYDWDILVNFSDDQEFITKGFDDLIRIQMQSRFGGTDGVLHFKDKNNEDKLMTLSIIGKEYYKRFNYIYHPSYKSLWCDNEAMIVAKKLEKYLFVDEVIFNHNHPAYKKADNDAQYLLTESFYGIDGDNFKKRQEINFNLTKTNAKNSINSVKLSILIPSMHKRNKELTQLVKKIFKKGVDLHRQKDFEILTDVDNGEMPTGTKRNNLVNRAKGDYVWFIDDDDDIHDDSLFHIFHAIEKTPDVIGFNGKMTTNGGQEAKFKISKDLPYTTIRDNQGKIVYLRHTNHLCPIKKSIAVKIPYDNIYFKEDYNYSIALKNSNLINTEVFIPIELYHYQYNSKK